MLRAEDGPHTGGAAYTFVLIEKVRGPAVVVGFFTLALAVAPRAQDFGQLRQTPNTYPTAPNALPTGNPFNAERHWMTPLVTMTPRLEQEFRADFDFMNQGNGQAQSKTGQADK
jgi:hypothetical protein